MKLVLQQLSSLSSQHYNTSFHLDHHYKSRRVININYHCVFIDWSVWQLLISKLYQIYVCVIRDPWVIHINFLALTYVSLLHPKCSLCYTVRMIDINFKAYQLLVLLNTTFDWCYLQALKKADTWLILIRINNL